MTRDKFKTYGDVFDNFTVANINSLISRRIFAGLEGPVSIGKEANIFTALRKDGSRIIVKIYRLETCDFNRMYDYIRTDPRFPKLKRSRRKVIFEWAKREYINLGRTRNAGVRVPTPIAIKDNIVVMEFIGMDRPSPKLKDCFDVDFPAFAGKTVDYMAMLCRQGLVHGDLSEFNILVHNRSPVFIDFSQATTLKDPKARMLLERDAKNISRYFSKRGLDLSAEEILRRIGA